VEVEDEQENCSEVEESIYTVGSASEPKKIPLTLISISVDLPYP
jgi:hypothetical protein